MTFFPLKACCSGYANPCTLKPGGLHIPVMLGRPFDRCNLSDSLGLTSLLPPKKKEKGNEVTRGPVPSSLVSSREFSLSFKATYREARPQGGWGTLPGYHRGAAPLPSSTHPLSLWPLSSPLSSPAHFATSAGGWQSFCFGTGLLMLQFPIAV